MNQIQIIMNENNVFLLHTQTVAELNYKICLYSNRNFIDCCNNNNNNKHDFYLLCKQRCPVSMHIILSYALVQMVAVTILICHQYLYHYIFRNNKILLILNFSFKVDHLLSLMSILFTLVGKLKFHQNRIKNRSNLINVNEYMYYFYF